MKRTTTYTTEGGDLVIEFDYQPFEAGSDVEPPTPESADICSVMAGKFEILDWCSRESILFFEEKCLESIQFESDNDI